MYMVHCSPKQCVQQYTLYVCVHVYNMSKSLAASTLDPLHVHVHVHVHLHNKYFLTQVGLATYVLWSVMLACDIEIEASSSAPPQGQLQGVWLQGA